MTIQRNTVGLDIGSHSLAREIEDTKKGKILKNFGIIDCRKPLWEPSRRSKLFHPP
jgi:hypothetical protein